MEEIPFNQSPTFFYIEFKTLNFLSCFIMYMIFFYFKVGRPKFTWKKVMLKIRLQKYSQKMIICQNSPGKNVETAVFLEFIIA